MPSSRAGDIGEWAEQRAAANLGVQIDREGWADLRAKNGWRYQVKATAHTRANGEPGRFRVWEKELKALKNKRASYVFVLYTTNTANGKPKALRIKKVPVSEVAAVVRGRWYDAHHRDKPGQQYKIPWDELISL